MYYALTGCPCMFNLEIVTCWHRSNLLIVFPVLHEFTHQILATDDFKHPYIHPIHPSLISCLMSKLHLFRVCTGVLSLRKYVHVYWDLEWCPVLARIGCKEACMLTYYSRKPRIIPPPFSASVRPCVCVCVCVCVCAISSAVVSWSLEHNLSLTWHSRILSGVKIMLRIMTSDERKVRVCSPVWHVLSPKNGMVRDPSPWEGQLWKEGVVNGVLVLLFPLQFSVEILHVLHRVPGAPCVTQTGFSKLSQDSLRTSACNPLRLWGSLHDTICSLLAITYSTLKKIVCIILLKIIFTIYHTRPQGVATPYQPTYHTRRRDNVGETGSYRGHTLSAVGPAGRVCRSSGG